MNTIRAQMIGDANISTTNSNITLGSTVNGAHDLSLSAGGGAISLGGAIGGAAGVASNYLQNVAKGINKVVDDAKALGLNMQSPQIMKAAQEAVKNQGLDVTKLEFRKQFQNSINKTLDEMRPGTFVPNTSPAQYLTDKTVENLKQVRATNGALYAPINADATPQVASQYKGLANELKGDLPKSIGMPTKDLPENPTLQQMLNFRQTLRFKLNQADAAASSGTISREDTRPYVQLMNGLQNDIKAAAEKSGLADQLVKAEAHFNEHVVPFEIYGKDMKGNINPDEVFQKFSAQLKSPRPNLPMIKQLASTVGPEGKDLMGWAKIETNYNRSLAFGGQVFDPKKFDTQFTKDKVSGLADKIYSPEHLAAIKGMTIINKEGSEMLKDLKPINETPLTAMNAPGKVIQGLLTTRPGMKLLSLIGTNSGNRGFIIKTVQDLLRTSTITAASQGNVSMPEIGADVIMNLKQPIK